MFFCYIETLTSEGFYRRILKFLFFRLVPRFFEVPYCRLTLQSLRDPISIRLWMKAISLGW